jgi:predicted GNAT family N-acyltransferase
MTGHDEVINTEPKDLDLIFGLFEHSIKYQEKHGYPSWKNYDKNAIISDIENKNQYKVMVNSTMAIVFSVCYSDRIIWRERENGDSIYLHRIVVNPEFKGQRLFGKILDWSIVHCRQRGLKNIRMDTWAANPAIVNYYKSFGFSFVENYTTPDTPELPVHNRSLALSLLEFRIDH